MNCLSIERLSFERDDIPLFERFDAQWRSGEIIQLAGHNGCGKTTLMRIVAGLVSPTSGLLSWNQHRLTSFEYKSSLLFLGHHTGIKHTMSPLENLQWYFGLNGLKGDENGAQATSNTANLDERMRRALTSVGLQAFHDVPCFQLSAGQQRRAALARLYLSEAPLWILDEPFTAIDKAGVQSLEVQIEQHAARGGIVVLTTHQAWNADRMQVVNLEDYKPAEGRYYA